MSKSGYQCLHCGKLNGDLLVSGDKIIDIFLDGALFKVSRDSRGRLKAGPFNDESSDIWEAFKRNNNSGEFKVTLESVSSFARMFKNECFCAECSVPDRHKFNGTFVTPKDYDKVMEAMKGAKVSKRR